MTPTILMALQDYAPVLISLFSFTLIIKTVGLTNFRLKPIATSGLVLCFTGGFLKATEKVIWALTTQEILWMKHSLFILNSLGFIFLASALWFALYGSDQKRSVWLLPSMLGLFEILTITLISSLTPGREWFFFTLGIAFLANLAMIVFLFLLSRKINHPKIGYVFIVSFALVISLVGLAKSPSPTLSIEWFKQGMNTLSASCFALGTWLLYKNMPKDSHADAIQITESYQNS